GYIGESQITVEVLPKLNSVPVADAGPDITIERDSFAGALITLDGSGSYDYDGDNLSYLWSWKRGSADGVSPEVAFQMGSKTITLTVSDGEFYVTDTVNITVVDTTLPQVTIITPNSGDALQDGVNLTAEASDIGGVSDVFFYIREPGGEYGEPIGYEDLSGTLNNSSGKWEYNLDSTQLPDGYFVLLAKAIDENGNEGWSNLVSFSIRNWAVIELLPASASYRAGRTMPVKFSLRIDSSVDPVTPFVYNEELEIRLFKSSSPNNIIQQVSTFGDISTQYRISSSTELYITNFKTEKTPAVYIVEIWRATNNFLIGNFAFETTKK
ncbi:MAG: Ig-like domain-containing protein, partial [Desulfobacterales bacterium]|nr:Ig-like domain-containing protein [Desulfobacterales bacterium]